MRFSPWSTMCCQVLGVFLVGLVVCAVAQEETSDDVGCKEIVEKVKDGEFLLDDKALKMVKGRMQSVLDCIQDVDTVVVVNLPEVPLEEGLVVEKPVTIVSRGGVAKLGCSEKGIQIRSDNVILKNFKIEGCTASKTEGFIHIEDSVNITLESIECRFNQNSEGPSCLSTSNATASLLHFTAVKNSGKDGGGLHMENSNIDVKLSTFEENSVTESTGGGAIYAEGGELKVSESSFIGNSADRNGGAILGKNCSGVLDSSQLKGNMAVMRGGGVHYSGQNAGETKRWTLHKLEVTDNVAGIYGGGFFVQDAVDLTVDASQFYENDATVEGGAIKIGHSLGQLAASLVVTDSNFVKNSAGVKYWESGNVHEGIPKSGGGAVTLWGEDTEFSCLRTHFSENKAGLGGAVQGNHVASLQFDSCTMSNNAAIRGGAMSCRGIGDMQHTQSVFEENTAQWGGAIALIGSEILYPTYLEEALLSFQLSDPVATIRIQQSKFLGNKALAAGGGIDVAGFSLWCKDCIFDSNSAVPPCEDIVGKGGGIRVEAFAAVFLEDSVVKSCFAQVGAGIYAEDGAVYGWNLNWDGNTASDVGGAVAVKFTPGFSIETSIISCVACSLERNEAKRAGIISILKEKESEHIEGFFGKHVVKNVHKTKSIRESDLQTIRANDEGDNPEVYFQFNKFSENVVQDYGPLLIVSDFHGIEICCKSECGTGEELKDKICIKQNIRGQRILGTLMEDIEVIPGAIVEHASGEELPPLKVSLKDALNYTAPVEATLTIRSLNSSVEISGPPTVGISIYGVSVVRGIIMRAVPGDYVLDIEIKSTEAGLVVLDKILPVSVRKCGTGEISRDGGRRCDACRVHFYSFDSNDEICKRCVGDAVCNGTTMVPKDGYWHFDSHSEDIRPCLTHAACKFNNGTERVYLLMDQAQRMNPYPVRWNESWYACNEGYGGVLCGSCQEGYGRSQSTECDSCQTRKLRDKFWRVVSIPLSIIILIVMISSFVKGANAYTRATLARCGLARTQALTMRRHECCGQSEVVETMNESTIDPGDVLKILINFVQVTTTITTVDNDWQEAMLYVLDCFDWISGMASESAYFAFSCWFKGPNRFIYATYLAISLPFLVWMLFILFALAQYKLWKIRSYDQFKTNCFVSLMAILDISYIGLTQKMAQIWYCIDLRGTKYWVEDTSIECHEHPHKYLFYFAGVPLLIFLSVGFPVALFGRLIHGRDKLHTKDMVANYGYFYQSYHSSCAYWEVLIQARKGLVAGISVLSGGYFSEMMGGCLSLAVLVIAGALQTGFDPYKEHKLNTMEAVSLFTSSFAFIIGSMVYSPDAHGICKKILTIVLTVVLISFVAYMLFEYVVALRNTLHEWLKTKREYKEYKGGVVSFVKVSVRALYKHSSRRMRAMGKTMKSFSSVTFGMGSFKDLRTMSPVDEEESSSMHADGTAPFLEGASEDDDHHHHHHHHHHHDHDHDHDHGHHHHHHDHGHHHHHDHGHHHHHHHHDHDHSHGHSHGYVNEDHHHHHDHHHAHHHHDSTGNDGHKH